MVRMFPVRYCSAENAEKDFLSVGALRGEGETGAVGTFVPTMAINDTGNVISFEIGAGAALFRKWEYGTTEDFGGPLPFILDIGMNFRVYKRLGPGYTY